MLRLPTAVVVTIVALLASTATAADSSRGGVEYHLPIDEHRRERQEQQQQQQRECEAGDSSCQQQQQQLQQHQATKQTQTQNHTSRGTSSTNSNNHNELKQASKESEDDDRVADNDYFDEDDEEDGPVLLKWLNEKMIPDVKACGVYLAPSTIPGAGLGVRIESGVYFNWEGLILFK